MNNERTHYFEKYKDKDGVEINLGDNVFGEDGKIWHVTEIKYALVNTHPITAEEVTVDFSNNCFIHGETRDLKPKWLSHKLQSKESPALNSMELDFGMNLSRILERLSLNLESLMRLKPQEFITAVDFSEKKFSSIHDVEQAQLELEKYFEKRHNIDINWVRKKYDAGFKVSKQKADEVVF